MRKLISDYIEHILARYFTVRGIFFIHFLPLNCYFKPQLHLPRFWKLALKAGRNRIAVIQLRSQWRNCDVNIENYWCNLAKLSAFKIQEILSLSM